MQQLKAKSEIISFGNTSLRPQFPDLEHQEMLQSLSDFREQHPEGWHAKYEQKDFAEFHNKQGYRFIALNKKTEAAKDVRNRTVFVRDLGFASKEATITDVGREYLKDDTSLSKWEITKLSKLFAIQFLKWRGDEEDNFKVYPILALIYCCLDFDNNLPYKFLKYIWATIHSPNDLEITIKEYKKNKTNSEITKFIDNKLIENIRKSEEYKVALENISTLKNEEIIESNKLKEHFINREIVPHGKSGKYLIATYKLFINLLSYWENKDDLTLEEKQDFIKEKLIGNISYKQENTSTKKVEEKFKQARHCIKSSLKAGMYNEKLFGDKTTKLSKENIEFFESLDLMQSKNKKDFLIEFHVLYKYLTKHVNIEEYEDLNFRHLKLCDLFIMDYQSVKLKIHFKYFFEAVKDELLKADIIDDESMYRKKLEKHHNSFKEIHPFLNENVDNLIERVKINEPKVRRYGLRGYEEKMRMEKLTDLISSVWTKSNLIDLLSILNQDTDLATRDKAVREKIIDLGGKDLKSVTIPTIFEYLIAITFFHLSGEKANLRKIIKSLDEDGYPTTHAAGGEPDIVFDYMDSSVLVEVTLSEKDNQRAMEAEPVPRHMAAHIIEGNKKGLCFFVAKRLDPNNLVVLRAYKNMKWYGKQNQIVDSMNIFPLEIKDLLNCLNKGIDLDNIFIKAKMLLDSEESDGYKWYKNEIESTFS